MNRIAIFDCDGTIVDSQAAICMAMERAFTEHDLVPPPRQAIRRIVGLSLPQAIWSLRPDGDEAGNVSLTESYKQAFGAIRRSGEQQMPLHDGIAELFGGLAEAGWLLGIATGMSDRGLHHLLHEHDLARYFVTLQTADRSPSKPHPAMVLSALAETGMEADRAVVIGDSSYDMMMAVDAGARAIGVAWGYHDRDELIDAGAMAVAGDMAELGRLLDGCFDD